MGSAISKMVETVFNKKHLDYIYKYLVSLMFATISIGFMAAKTLKRPSNIISDVLYFFGLEMPENYITLLKNIVYSSVFDILIITIIALCFISLTNNQSKSNRSYASLQLCVLLSIEKQNIFVLWCFLSFFCISFVCGLVKDIKNTKFQSAFVNSFFDFCGSFSLNTFVQIILCLTPLLWLIETPSYYSSRGSFLNPLYIRLMKSDLPSGASEDKSNTRTMTREGQ